MVRQLDDPDRTRILEAASALLQAEGPDALTNRRVAREAGCTTMTLYTRFGSKGGLLDALIVEGVERLTEAQDAALRDDMAPRARVRALCAAYRSTALRHRGHYRLMFSQGVGDHQPSPDTRARLFCSFERLVAAVREAVDAGDVEGVPEQVAWQLFAACHGHIALELDGLADIVPRPASAYAGIVERVLG